jgi:PleD family two-component response regulator
MAKGRLRVLLAEKRLSEARIILREICAEEGRALELVFVGTREELGTGLKTYCPDVALLDLALLQPEAAEHLRVLHFANKSVPILLFAGAADKVLAEECLSAGARDYLLEGYMDERTVTRVLRAAIGERREESEAPSTDEKRCGFCAGLENVDEIRKRVGKREVDTMLEGLTRALERNVRARDKVMLRSCGHIDLVLENTNEQCFGSIAQRLRNRVKQFCGPFLLDLSSVVAIRAGGRAVAFEALMKVPPEFAGMRENYSERRQAGE